MVKTDPFAVYQLPIGLAEGVEIPLPGTPAVFKCVLPGTMNEDFNVKLMSALNTKVREDGKMTVDSVKFQQSRKSLFFETCILEAKGLPEGMEMDEFFKAYPLAARALFDRAVDLAMIADTEANDALGKLSSLLSGKPSGEENTISTKV